MTESIANIVSKKVNLPTWGDVKCGDFVKLGYIKTPYIVHVSGDEYTLICLIGGSAIVKHTVINLPMLEKIYSKSEITLYD